MNVLELFAGTASFSNAALRSGHTVFTSDYDEQFNTHYCVDIMEFDINKLPFKPDVIWASPPCETFSVASIGRHWHRGGEPKTEAAEEGKRRVLKTIEIIGIYFIAFVKLFNQRLSSLIGKGIDIRIHSFTTNIFSDYYTILCIIKSRIEKQINC